VQTIVLASRKGGAGKTTLSAHLAVAAERAGAGPVAIIDADPMSGLSTWWNKRSADTPICAKVDGRGFPETLASLEKNGIRLVVIDTPPASGAVISSVLGIADLVVIPVVPSPHDIWAIGDTIGAVEDAGTPLVFVINNASGARLTAQATRQLSQHGTVALTVCKSRQDYRASMVDGRVCIEVTPNGKSAIEISELWTYLQSRLKIKEKVRGKAG
jgi:chromosome partitioning protein